MKILYVENHAVFASQVCHQFLSKHSVRVVPSLASAHAALAEETYELMIVDFDLDDGKGDELVRTTKLSYSKLKIIGASSHDAGNNALLNAGANAICGKMEFNKIEHVLRALEMK